MHIHATSPQLLNEMIQYADENDIMRSRDMIIRKVITEQGEVRFPTFFFYISYHLVTGQ